MVVILIENREKVFKLISIKLFLYTVVLQSIAVFFSTIFYLFRFLFTLEEAYIFLRHFDLFGCFIFLTITAKFVLFGDLLFCLNTKSQTEQEEKINGCKSS